MHYTYKPHGVCSRAIELDIDGGVVQHCRFVGGCTGNTQGVSRLVEGMKVEEVIDRLQGILCRNGTSCPDQLAKALRAYQAENG